LFAFGQAPKLPAQPQKITVAAAIFTDGSYEGDVRFAAKLKARQTEASTVDRLMQPVVGRIVGDQSIDDEARTALIKTSYFALPSPFSW
jgi:hypothetical protein